MAAEPDIRAFLKRILQTLSMGILWMMINITFGVYYRWAFFDTKPSSGNYCYYIFFFISLVALLFYFYRKWKEKI